MQQEFRQVFLGLALVLLAGSCASDQAASLREAKPNQLGIANYGYLRRLSSNQAAGLTFDAGSGQAFYMKAATEDGEWLTSEDEGKDPKISHFNVNFFAHHYPWETSAFFVGLGYAYKEQDFSFKEPLSEDATQKIKIKYTDMASYVGVPLGWAWVWDRGFSLTLDFGPRWRVSHRRHIEESGMDQVNLTSRDDTMDELEETYIGRSELGGGTMLLGFSF